MELRHKVSLVDFDRARDDRKDPRYFLRMQPLTDQLQHLELAPGQPPRVIIEM